MKRPWFSMLGCAAALLAASVATADPWQDILGYRFGQSRTALVTLEDQIRGSRPDQLPTFEDRLLAALQSPAATQDCRDWACRQLRQVGSARSVPALATLLADRQLATVARLALQSIPGPQVDAALRQALPTVSGELKAGVIQTLGARRDRQAVPLLAPLVTNANPVVAEMALYALRHIGGAEAVAAIQQAKVPAQLARYRCDALLRAAAAMPPPQAAGIDAAVLAESVDPITRIAALRALAASDPSKAGPAILDAVAAADKRVRLAAVQLACTPGSQALSGLLGRVPSLPVDAQVTFLTLIDDPAALPCVRAETRSAQADVAQAAAVALGRIGDASMVAPLLDLAATATGPVQEAARASLAKLRAKPANELLILAAEQQRGVVRAEAIRALGVRGVTQAVPGLLKIAAADRTARVPILEALGLLADAESLPALVRLLAASADAAPRDAAQAAITAVCRRAQDQEAAAGAVADALPGADIDARVRLLTLVAGMPSRRSLDALRAAVKDADATVRAAAIRGLAGWPDPVVLDDLVALARSTERPAHRVLALRGIARLATIPGRRSTPQTARLLAESLTLAARPEEKRLLLAALGEVNDCGALAAALECLGDKQVGLEAATAVVRIAKNLRAVEPQAARRAVERVLCECPAPVVKQLATAALAVLDLPENIAPQGTATSPDDLEKDGASGGDQAAIDNRPATYWDEVDGRPLYRLVVTFKGPERVAAISILGYAQHNYAPKTFDILCDGRVVQHVEGARYQDNLLVVRFPAVTCTRVELRITGYYGRSPGVRELGIYRAAGVK